MTSASRNTARRIDLNIEMNYICIDFTQIRVNKISSRSTRTSGKDSQTCRPRDNPAISPGFTRKHAIFKPPGNHE